MADKLVETDEEVEKAGMVPKGGSARFRRRVDNAHRKTMDRQNRARPYGDFKIASPRIFPKRRVRKSTTPLSDLYTAIEKARRLMPKGGSSKLRNRLWTKREKLARALGFDGAKGRRIGRATSYLARRRQGAPTGPDRNYTKPITAPRTGKYK